MASISINTSQLTFQKFLIPEQGSEWIQGAGAPTLHLEPGNYSFHVAPGLAASFQFTVTPAGIIDYPDANDAFIHGRGTTTLDVSGFPVTLDARSLSHDLLPLNIVGASPLGRGAVHQLTLVPASGYGFQPAAGIVADFRFGLGIDGKVTLDPKYAGFAQASEQTLTLNGYQVTIDGRHLSHDLLPLNMLGNSTVLKRDTTNQFTYMPATGYGFQPAAGIVADFRFGLGIDGKVTLDPKYAGFAQASEQTLTLNGYQVTIDGRHLSHDLLPLNMLGNSTVLKRDTTNQFTYMPAAGHGFVAAPGVLGDFRFGLSADGKVTLDPKYAGFAQASGQTLTLNGYQVTLDTSELLTSVKPSLLGYAGGPLAPGVHTLTVIPASKYTLFGQSAPVFQFSLDIAGITTLINAPDGVTVMSDRRWCGVPDNIATDIQKQTYGSPGGRWSRRTLTYSIDTTNFIQSPGFTPVDAVNAITASFTQWQAVGGIFTFTATASNGDIKVSFGGRELDTRFGGQGDFAGTGAYPESGLLSFDSAELWTSSLLTSVALHEIGHVLGLAHSNSPASLMYPYDRGLPLIDAESSDALRNLYGWGVQISLGDRSTTDRPALAEAGRVTFTGSTRSLHMVWKGTGDDSGLYESTLGTGSWSPQSRIMGLFGSTHSPSLTSFTLNDGASTGLFMAWKGVEDDSGLYFATNDGFGWTTPAKIPGVGSSNRPAVLNHGGTFMAWKGIEGDSGIYWSRHDATGWESQEKVLGVGTSDSPALVFFNNRLYMFWKGVEDDAHIYYTWRDDINPIWRPQQAVFYAETETGGGVPVFVGTSHGPSVTVDGSRIMLAWKGVEGDPGIYFSLFDGNEFTGQIRVSGVGTSQGPAVYGFDGTLHMAWKGVENDNGIWWTTR
jgi:hypothetical protein